MAGLTVRLTTEPRIYRRAVGRLCADVRREDATLGAGPAAKTDPDPPAPLRCSRGAIARGERVRQLPGLRAGLIPCLYPHPMQKTIAPPHLLLLDIDDTALNLTAEQESMILDVLPSRASYMRAFAEGRYRVSGMDLCGKASSYGARYAESAAKRYCPCHLAIYSARRGAWPP